MTEEVDARARLLAHYQDRLLLLAAKLEAAAAEAVVQGRTPAKKQKSMVTRLQRDVVSTREKVRRLKETIGSP